MVTRQIYKEVTEVNNHRHGTATQQHQDKATGITIPRGHGGKVLAMVTIKEIITVTDTQIKLMEADPMKNGMQLTPAKETLQEGPAT